MTGEVFVGRASAMRIEAPNALDRLTYDVDENRIDGFSEDDFVRSQSAAWDGAPELWAVPASAGEFPIEPARFTGLDLRGYQQMRLVLNVGGQAGLTGATVFVKAVVRQVHAASLILRAPVSRSGFGQTSPAGGQSRGCPDHRSGLAARASAQRQARAASTV